MDFRQRLEQNRIRPASEETPAEPEDNFPCQYFATDRGGSPACLELRLSDGSRRAFPYSLITEMNFEIETGIEILTGGKKIKIQGRNLNKLYDQLITYRVRYAQVAISHDLKEDGLFIKEITIEDLIY